MPGENYKVLTEQEMAARMRARPGIVRRFKAAGEEALLALVEGRKTFKQVQGALQFLRHLWLSDDYDLIGRNAAQLRLRMYGVEQDDRHETMGGECRRPDTSVYGASGLAVGGKGRKTFKMPLD